MKCSICGVTNFLQKHHHFSQSKLNVKLYGRKLIDDPRNISIVCMRCHINEAKGLIKWSEYEFITALGIEKRGKS
jgi:hypothetical protein